MPAVRAAAAGGAARRGEPGRSGRRRHSRLGSGGERARGRRGGERGAARRASGAAAAASAAGGAAGGESAGGAAGARRRGGESAGGSEWAAWVDAAAASAGGLHPKVLAAATSTREPPQVRGGGYVVDALEAALWALRTTTTFEDGVLAAVNLGDDADTTAAIYGQLAGAIYGVDGIPERWRAKVHRGDEIIAMADALYDLDRSRPALARYAHVRPTRVVECRTPEEVAEAIRSSDRLAIRSGGHCFAGRSTTTGTLIDVGPIDHVRLDGTLATIGAGARLGAIYDTLARHGRTLVAGCGPTVGIAGLTLGGGIGILGRRHGLTCDQLVAATVVLADGRIVHTDDHPDLLWALRGAGGGRFGVVTELVFTTVPAERTTVFDVIVPRTPETVAALAAVGPARARGARREPARPRRRAPTSSAPSSARAHEAEQHLRRLRPATRGSRSSSSARPSSGSRTTARTTGENVRSPAPGSSTQPIAPPLDCKLDFMPLGGAFNAPASDATAYPHRDALLLPARRSRRPGGGRRGHGRAAARSASIPTSPSPTATVWDPAYHLGNRERLLALRDTYDPDGLFSPPP